MSLRMLVQNTRFCVRDTGFSVILGVSLQVAVWNAGFCVRDTGFSAFLGVSLRMLVQDTRFYVRDTGFSVVLGVSLHGKVQIAGRDTDVGWRWRGNVTWLSAWLSEFEPHDVVVHVEAVSDVEVALAEDAEAEMVVEADRRIVAVHVQFDTGFASF